MEEIYLDLLTPPPRQNQHVERIPSPFVYNELDVKFGIKKYDSKKFKMAHRIAKVDELVQENDKLKSQNNELHQQLKSFQVTAQQVQELYTEEKLKYSTLKNSFDSLQKEYNKIDMDLTSKSMVNDQLKARLAEYDGRPINFNNLVVKYVSIMDKLRGDDILKYSPDKDLVERLKEYCATIRLKIPTVVNSPKKPKSRGNKIKTQEMSVQCNLLEKISLQKQEYQRCKNQPKLQDQSTQYSSAKRDQGSQYISTMITRHTNTEKIIYKHVQTMFPETPAVDDILKVYSRWSDIRSVSPLLESPPPVGNTPFEKTLKKFSTTGTCTMLCNIRRKIDYLSLNNSSNIKQELFTPSASPTLTCYPITTSRAKDSSVPANLNPSLFNSTIKSSLGQLPSDAFNELWQIFGKMLLSLLQNSNAGIANTIQTSTLNQQQFLDWLLELFMNSQPQTTTTAQTQTMHQTDSISSTSPLIFNDTSALLTNIVRPQPQKTVSKTNHKEDDIHECLTSNSTDNNSTISTCTLNFPLQSFSQDSNSMDREVQQIQITSNKTELQATNACEADLLKIPRINNLKGHSKSKHKILDQIQEILPEIKLNKRNRKALKRILKNNNHRKKSLKTKKSKRLNEIKKQSSPVVILTNENNNDDTIETAVDFLKTFALAPESCQLREENFSENEKIFIKQITNENISNDASNISKTEDFTFIKPTGSLSHSQASSSYTNSDTFVIQSREPKDITYIENKYQLLFGDSDSELEEQEMEIESFNRNLRSVIKSTANSSSGKFNVNECSESTNGKSWTLDDTQDWTEQATNQQSFLKVKTSENTNTPVDNNLYKTCHKILGNAPQQQYSLPNRSNAFVENLCNRNSSQKMLLRSDEPFDLYNCENMKDSKYFHIDTNKESLNQTNNCFVTDIEHRLENDLNLSSDQHSIHEDDQEANYTLNAEESLFEEEAATIQGLKSVNNNIKQHDIKSNSSNFDRTDIINSDEFYTTALPTLEDSSMTEDDEAISKTNKSSNFEAKLNKEAVNIQDLKDNDRKSIFLSLDGTESIKTDELYTTTVPTFEDGSVKKTKSVAEINIQSLPNLNDNYEYVSNNSLNTCQHVTAPVYSSDFENDFELSSDNESLISDNDSTGINSINSGITTERSQNNAIFKESFNSNSSRSSENNSPEDINSIISEITTELPQNSSTSSENDSPEDEQMGLLQNEMVVDSNQHKINQLSNWEESFKNFAFNFSTKSKEKAQKLSKTIRNFKSKQLKCRKDSKFFESNPSDNSRKESFERQTEKIQKQKDIVKESKNSLQSSSESDDECLKQRKELINNPKAYAFNKFKENTKLAQPNSLIDSKDDNLLFMQNASFEPIENLEGDNCYETENKMFSNLASNTCKTKHFLVEKKEKNEIFTTRHTQSLFPKNESTNQSPGEENPLIWSVITVSDSSFNDQTSDNKELFEAPGEIKDDNKVVPKISGLNNLKLLDCNSMKYTKATKAVKALPNNSNIAVDYKVQSNINLPTDISKLNHEHETIPYISSQQKFLDANSSACHRDFIKANKYDLEKDKVQKVNKITKTSTVGNMTHENNPNDKDSIQEINSILRHPAILNMEPKTINELISYDSVDQIDLSDNLSTENELTIDEEANENSTKELETDQLNNCILKSEENCDDSINSTNISSLLNSTLYNEVLSESIKPIVTDLLMEKEMNMSLTQKPKRSRKRKSECLAEVQPCKRSERLKAKQMLLEGSLNFSKTPIELGKYTKGCMNVINNVQLKSYIKEDTKNINFKAKCEIIQNSKLLENENALQIGFFRERDVEEEVPPEHHKKCAVTKTQNTEVVNDKAFLILTDAKKTHEQEHQSLLSLECEQPINCHKYKEVKQGGVTAKCRQECEKDCSQKDCISIKPIENFIFSDSPQSPAPLETNNDNIAEIPIERLPQFMPQDTNQSLFDVLINSYNYENHNKILESVTTKEHKRQEHILNQFSEQLISYCYNEMELDLYCTSTRVINKLLSISPDYNLIQKAVIIVAKKAKGTNIPENELPPVIQDMPPEHLPKCLQRLFVFLKNVVTRDGNFCKDLAYKIESILFSYKQTEKLSLQATLNLTQLYLMTCKVQEYLQIATHPARIFIAKCLYFYLKKSVLMIHEVLMWYPTVLPYREDKTYDRSDALISVIQQILMNTKYDVFNSDFRDKTLLSKLRYEYHFEPYKPSLDEVINVLVEKLKNSKFYNICLAFGLLSKRIDASTTQNNLLNQHLLPLANEYFNLALQTNEYDKRIGVLLEIISMLVKPLPIETDIEKYFNEFARFLNRFERQPIQEAALCSILRLQRFNVEYCYYLLRHFQPTYILSSHTQAMLKTFLYRRPLTFWKNLKDA